MVGLSFKDIDRVLKSVINEKKAPKSDDDLEREYTPEKWNPPGRPERNSSRPSQTSISYTREDVTWFLAQKDVILSDTTPKSLKGYKTYTAEQADALIKGNCHPSILKRK